MNQAITLHHAEVRPDAVSWIRQARLTVGLWLRRMRERDELSQWGERDLHDIGISSADAWVEMQKPFWRA